MSPSPAEQIIRDTLRHFVRNEYFDDSSGEWVQVAGTRLPDNKTNRRKLERDFHAMSAKGMRVRTVKYEVKEEIIGIIYGEGATVGLR